MSETNAPTDRDRSFGGPLTTLGSEMSGLSEKLMALNRDIDDLQRSTERWGENQRAISESLSQAADSLATFGEDDGTPTADTTQQATGWAAADD